MPEAGGYSGFLHGKVVDMFYFPIIDTHLPEWIPIVTNKHVIFIEEAHLLFDEVSNALLSQIESIVKLIRSKGISLFFVIQNPGDIP